MELIPPEDFFEWVQSSGIGYSESYPDYLEYRAIPQLSRFWKTPVEARQVPFFISHMLCGLSPWESCTLWPRDGYWLPADDMLGIHDRVRDLIVRASGIPSGFRGGVRFPIADRDGLVSVLFAQVIFGWSGPDDVFVIPDHARQFLQTDHHDVIHAYFSSEEQVASFIGHMEAANFFLPEELPDWTFLKPDWME